MPPDDEAPPEIISLAEAAQLLKVSFATARRWAAAGKLPGLVLPKVGHQWRVNRQRLYDYLDGNGA